MCKATCPRNTCDQQKSSELHLSFFAHINEVMATPIMTKLAQAMQFVIRRENLYVLIPKGEIYKERIKQQDCRKHNQTCHITQNGDICLLTVAKQAENFIYCYLIFSITQII